MIFQALNESAEAGELLLVEGGFCRFHCCLDQSVTIREVLVLPSYRGRGIGRQLVKAAAGDAPKVVARCPAHLPSNAFWDALGFTLLGIAVTRTERQILLWQRVSSGGR